MVKQIELPSSLEKLGDLATNLWFSWNPDARDLFREIDIEVWRSCGKNPVKFLKLVDPVKIDAFSKDEEFLKKVSFTWDRFQDQ